MSVYEIRDFIFKNYHKQIGYSTEKSYSSMKHLKRKYLLLLANKLIEKMSDHCNAKEHYQAFWRKKHRKSVKQLEIILYQPKTFENPNIFCKKSVITEYPKTSHKLSKTIGKDEKVGSNSFMYSDTKKVKIFWSKKYTNNKTRTCF